MMAGAGSAVDRNDYNHFIVKPAPTGDKLSYLKTFADLSLVIQPRGDSAVVPQSQILVACQEAIAMLDEIHKTIGFDSGF